MGRFGLALSEPFASIVGYGQAGSLSRAAARGGALMVDTKSAVAFGTINSTNGIPYNALPGLLVGMEL